MSIETTDPRSKEELLNEMKYTHDKLKDHPYWISFDPSLWHDMLKYFKRMQSAFLEYRQYCNPQSYGRGENYRMLYDNKHVPGLDTFIHDNNGFIYSYVYEDQHTERFGRMVTQFQQFISGIHALLEDRTEACLIYRGKTVKSKFIPLGTNAGYRDDPKCSGWYMYYELSDSEYEAMENYFKRRIEYDRKKSDWQFIEHPTYDERCLAQMEAGTFYFYQKKEKVSDNEE